MSEAYDVVVIGAGNAAMAAAMSAHEEGASIVVLEKAPKELSPNMQTATHSVD